MAGDSIKPGVYIFYTKRVVRECDSGHTAIGFHKNETREKTKIKNHVKNRGEKEHFKCIPDQFAVKVR